MWRKAVLGFRSGFHHFGSVPLSRILSLGASVSLSVKGTADYSGT